MRRKEDNFGVLKDLAFKKLTKQEQLEILVERNLYQVFTSIGLNSTNVIKLDEIKEVTQKRELSPTYAIREQFYNFFTSTFQFEIDKDFFFFSKGLEDEIFGMDYVDQRKIALKHFKEKFLKVTPKDFALAYKTTSENGLERVKMLNLFKVLKGARTAMNSNLGTQQNIIKFLIGDERYFQSAEFQGQEFFKKALHFETGLKILLSLNDTYQFEEDAEFSNLGVLKERYKVYNNVFIDFEIFRWTHKKIKSFIDNKPSNIDSLHQALLESSLISEKKKTFIDYINQEHKMSITKIRHYARDTNPSHDFRLRKFKEEIQDLTSKK